MSVPSTRWRGGGHGGTTLPQAMSMAVLAAASTACTSISTPTGWPLEGPYWRLARLQGVGPVPAGAREAHIVLEQASRRAGGIAGCNRFNAGYAVQGQTIRFQPGAATRMACREGMDVEREFLRMLDAAASWRIDGDRLQLLDAGGGVLAEFSAASERFACDGGRTVLVHYDAREPQHAEALVSFEATNFTMRAVPAASGARYVAVPGRTPDTSLEWHTKGGEGLLVEAPVGSEARQPPDVRTVARCTRR